jgi:tRNA pseudouridine(38-40) synthase
MGAEYALALLHSQPLLFTHLSCSRLLSLWIAVEAEIEHALLRAGVIEPYNYNDLDKIGWSRASRTDAGVHALALVFGVKLRLRDDSPQSCAEALTQINSQLPSHVRVFALQPVTNSFNARRFCIKRRYEYLFPCDVLPADFSFATLERCTQALTGNHRFHNFTGSSPPTQKGDAPFPCTQCVLCVFVSGAASFLMLSSLRLGCLYCQ